MKRAVASVATTTMHQKGMGRLEGAVLAEGIDHWMGFDHEPKGCPPHRERPYAFKAYALKEAAVKADLVLWCDSCIVPIRSMEPLWEQIERDGYMIVRNGFSNSMWCSDSWYADCFPGVPLEEAREQNSHVQHVVAGVFGLNLRSEIGARILAEYYRLASETRAFCGPWLNSNAPDNQGRSVGAFCAPCGPPSVKGHRHDQSCLSIIAHREGVTLSDPPRFFSYQGGQDESTIVVADASVFN